MRDDEEWTIVETIVLIIMPIIFIVGLLLG